MTKIVLGHFTLNFCFCIWWDLRVTWCIPVHPGHETPTHYFLCSGGTGRGMTKSASGHIAPNMCFDIRWDLQII
jgi:hypothetical protein